MKRGKETCRILKDIRRQIAEANDIEFITSECRYQGDCLGTCPKCEAEVRYLEQQLSARHSAGKAIALAGISAGMIVLSGCSSNSNVNDSTQNKPQEDTPLVDTIPYNRVSTQPNNNEISDIIPIPGEILEGEVELDTTEIIETGEVQIFDSTK